MWLLYSIVSGDLYRYPSGIHISYISQTILYLISTFMPVVCFIQNCFQGIYMYVHSHFEDLFIYHSLTVSHVCLMDFSHYQLLLPHLMPAPTPGKVPTLVSHLLFCVAHWASVGLGRNLKSCVLFPCVGTGKCKQFYGKRKSCLVF